MRENYEINFQFPSKIEKDSNFHFRCLSAKGLVGMSDYFNFEDINQKRVIYNFDRMILKENQFIEKNQSQEKILFFDWNKQIEIDLQAEMIISFKEDFLKTGETQIEIIPFDSKVFYFLKI